MNRFGQWVDRNQQVNLNELFPRMTLRFLPKANKTRFCQRFLEIGTKSFNRQQPRLRLNPERATVSCNGSSSIVTVGAARD